MGQGFYKQENGEWLYAQHWVSTPDYELKVEEKDSYDLPHDGWNWYDQSPIVVDAFELWVKRVDAINSLREQGEESSLALPMGEFYKENIEDISEFIKNGSREFLTICEESTLPWMDLRVAPENPSPREILIETLSPIVVE